LRACRTTALAHLAIAFVDRSVGVKLKSPSPATQWALAAVTGADRSEICMAEKRERVMAESYTTFSFARGRSARKPAIICGKLDFGSLQQVCQLISALARCLSDPLVWHRLEVDKGCYFRVPDGPLSTGPGWYVKCDEQRTPLYWAKPTI
jgi:hypothetical protein